MLLAGGQKNLEENVYHCHFVQHKFTWTALGMNPGLFSEKPANNHLSYGSALGNCKMQAGCVIVFVILSVLRSHKLWLVCSCQAALCGYVDDIF